MSEKTKSDKKDKDISNKSFILKTCPKFIILGAQKSGTTALYAYVCDHPNVSPFFFNFFLKYFTHLLTELDVHIIYISPLVYSITHSNIHLKNDDTP